MRLYGFGTLPPQTGIKISDRQRAGFAYTRKLDKTSITGYHAMPKLSIGFFTTILVFISALPI